jgi:hypothetical protein
MRRARLASPGKASMTIHLTWSFEDKPQRDAPIKITDGQYCPTNLTPRS